MFLIQPNFGKEKGLKVKVRGLADLVQVSSSGQEKRTRDYSQEARSGV